MKVVFLLRHGERLLPDPADELTPDGVKRAELLGRMLANSGIRFAFCSNMLRTHQMIEPLQQSSGVKIKREDVTIDRDHIPDYVQQTVAKVTALPDEAIAIIVSHDIAITPIVEGLTGRTVDEVTGTQFDKLFVLSIPKTGPGNVSLMRYGVAT